MTAADVVLADGTRVRADADHETDLLWALKGGGGNLGVVTALEFDLYRVDELVAGMLVWPWEQAADVLGRYVEWAESAPDEVTASARLLQIPPLPDIPEAFRGRRLVVVDGAVLGTEQDAAAILAPLRRARARARHVRRRRPLGAAAPAHGPGRPDARPRRRHVPRGSRRRERSPRCSRSPGPGTTRRSSPSSCASSAGALRRTVPGAGAQGSLEGSFAFFAVGAPMGPGVAEAIMARVDALKAALAPWDSGATFVNFADTRKTLADAIGGHGVTRLQAIREEIDPDGLFRLGRSLAVPEPGDAAVAA